MPTQEENTEMEWCCYLFWQNRRADCCSAWVRDWILAFFLSIFPIAVPIIAMISYWLREDGDNLTVNSTHTSLANYQQGDEFIDDDEYNCQYQLVCVLSLLLLPVLITHC